MTFSQQPRQGSRTSESPPIERNLVAAFKASAQDRVKLAEDIARSDLSRASYTQIRNFFDYVIQVKQSHQGSSQDKLKDETLNLLAMLRPRIAYIKARSEGKWPVHLQKGFDDLLKSKELFQDGQSIQNLYSFVEAIVAFHKCYNQPK